MALPTLYKKTNTGAIQQWTIKVETREDPGGPGVFGSQGYTFGEIVTTHGQVGGAIQETRDVVREGKNLGKANATTPLQQAEAEAQAKWTKQKKKGYVEHYEDAKDGLVDELIEGGISPMLAPNKSYPKDDDLVKRIDFPCYGQPKLDGIRCVSIIENGKATLWSRSRKRIKSVPHIITALEARFASEEYLALDGELYSHEFKDNFEDLISILRKDEPDAEGLYLQAQYHMYDLIQWTTAKGETVITHESAFIDRTHRLHWLLDRIQPPLFCVDTVRAQNLAALVEVYEVCLKDGYEGAMARNAGAPYEIGKRSKHIAKMKEFQDAEFRIVGITDGRGKDAGTAATFRCLTDDGKEFGARLKATYDYRRELFQKPELWTKKKVTVTFKRWTADGIPYIPVAKAIREGY